MEMIAGHMSGNNCWATEEVSLAPRNRVWGGSMFRYVDSQTVLISWE